MTDTATAEADGPLVTRGNSRLNDIVFDESIYPRSMHIESTVDRYADALDAGAQFPPIILETGTDRLLDGRHRMLAYERAGRDCVSAEWHCIPDGVSPKLYAASLSTRHGEQIAEADLCGIARELYSGDDNMQTVADYLGVSYRKVQGWCADLFQADRIRRIAVAVLLRHAGWTQQAIGDWLGVAKQTVSDFIQQDKTGQLTEADLHAATGRLPDGVAIDIADAIEAILYAEQDAEALAELQQYADDGNANAVEVLAESQHRNNRERLAAFRLRDEKARKAASEAARKRKQEKQDHDEAIRRDANRVKAFLSGYDGAYSMRTHPHRDEVIAALTPGERKRFLAIEKETTWPSHRI